MCLLFNIQNISPLSWDLVAPFLGYLKQMKNPLNYYFSILFQSLSPLFKSKKEKDARSFFGLSVYFFCSKSLAVQGILNTK